MKVPGVSGGKATFTKLFRQGIVAYGPFALTNHKGKEYTIKDVQPKPLSVPSDGKRGGPKRVVRWFPFLTEWQTTIEISVLDERITDEITREHLQAVGMFIGFGSMRVENGGLNGRFEVVEK